MQPHNYSAHISQTGTGGPQTISVKGDSRILTFRGADNTVESITAADVKMFKDMCGLIEYIAKVDPKFVEYVTAYKASKTVTK